MPSHHHARRSRRLSRKSPMEVADYDWQGAASLNVSNVDIATTLALPGPPSPSSCTVTSTDSPPSLVTHLPFTPGSSHTRNRKEGHIPRPPNAFMVFRSWLWNKDNLKSIERDNRNVSRIAGRYWNELSESERAPFRAMAEEAKARHAQLYPEYRYSPGSQKKLKTPPRRSHRSAEIENEKCNKVVNLLMSGFSKCDVAKNLAEARTKVELDQDGIALTSEVSSSVSTHAAPRNKLKRPAALPSSEPRSKKQKVHHLPSISPPPTECSIALPVLPIFEELPEPELTPKPPVRTPELYYPSEPVQEFVAIEDIPYLQLDDYSNPPARKGDEGDFHALFPSHMKPGAQSIFTGVKPEAMSFVDSCVLSAHTTDASIMPTAAPFADFGTDTYASLEPRLVPLGSPVFTNPFDSCSPSLEHTAMLGTLDQLFGQPVSPLSQIFPIENW